MKEKDSKPKEELPSAVDDCADVTSAYERYKKIKRDQNFLQ